MPPLPGPLSKTFVDIVGPAHVLVDERRAGFERDWTGRFVGSTPAVLRPATTEEVSGVIDACRPHGVAVVPQGGNTGLVGGGVPLAGEVVVSLTRLDGVEVDRVAGVATVGAGSTIGHIHDAAGRAGWAYGVDFGARDSATVGGTVATDAGGTRVLRHGTTRRQLLGVEAVLGTGATVSHLSTLEKDNTGYDLAQLMCGSEGTLGVVTAATVRLVPPTRHRVTALVGLEDVAAAADGAHATRRAVPDLEAAELWLAAGTALVARHHGWTPPLTGDPAAYLLLEAGGASDPSGALADAIDALFGVVDVAVATESRLAAGLWRWREAHTEAINGLGPPHKLDVTLPPATFAAFLADVPAIVAAVRPTAQTWLFGHAGDGNVHVNVTGVAPGDADVDEAVLVAVSERGGSISAEHGIGTAKKPWLHLARTPEEIATFAAVKRALDPDRILNPAVLF